MKNRIVSIVLSLALCLTLIMPMAAEASTSRDLSKAESWATAMKTIGIFKGVSDSDFALDRAPTRIEALVMLIRALGKENTALNGTWYHPFQDVPKWADKYVGYAYSTGLTKGISATKYGTSDATAQMYVTFILRALGYSDTNNLDFSYENPYTLANLLELFPEEVDLKNFLRADVVYTTVYALLTELKDSEYTLADKLIVEGAFTQSQYDDFYDMIFGKQGDHQEDDADKVERAYAFMAQLADQYGVYEESLDATGFTFDKFYSEDRKVEYLERIYHHQNPDYVFIGLQAYTKNSGVYVVSTTMITFMNDGPIIGQVILDSNGELTRIGAKLDPELILPYDDLNPTGFTIIDAEGDYVDKATSFLYKHSRDLLKDFHYKCLVDNGLSIADLGFKKFVLL